LNQLLKKISITTGDTDGIGLEVSIKSLLRIGPQKGTVFFLYRSEKALEKDLNLLDRRFQRLVVGDLSDGLDFLNQQKKISSKLLIDVASPKAPPFWVEESAQFCMKKALNGMATAPMSKELIHQCGFKDMGHTDILSRVSKAKSVRMGFIGDRFNVVLATGHLPLKKVSSHIKIDTFKIALRQAQALSETLKLTSRPIALLGLNPHAGENGLIGNEEIKVLRKVINWAQRQGYKIEGPLTPDAAFLPLNWKRYSCYVACYHDQGLIPFKMIHGQDSGCHLSLGLPFVRTSVDHGTAKDIFGKNKANPQSMISALQFCMKLIK
jgi:4-hydroxythreonine-4-phosphate dehydrogenase